MTSWQDALPRYNTLLVLTGTLLLGASTGLIGVFAVLRRRALVGDTLAHAALPGLCLSFLLAGQRHLGLMLVGAFASGLLGLLVFRLIRASTPLGDDAGLAIVLSVFFGAGIVLSRWIQNLATEGSKAGLDSYILGKTAGMVTADVTLIASMALLLTLAVLLLRKEFGLIAFDPAFAQALGWPVVLLDVVQVFLLTGAIVIGLPAVGVVMIAALLILPAASARFWTDRLGRLLLLSALLGGAMGVLGTLLSARFDELPAGPIMVLVGTAIFAASALIAPEKGLVAKWQARRQPLLPPADEPEAEPRGVTTP